MRQMSLILAQNPRIKQVVQVSKQPILGILSTDKENNYPRFIKLRVIADYTGLSLKKNIEKCCVLSHDALLNTDGEKGFNTLNEEIQVKNEKISYEEKDHRLLWLNIIIGNIKNNITGIYHGITKREMPLFLNEQKYSFTLSLTVIHIKTFKNADKFSAF